MLFFTNIVVTSHRKHHSHHHFGWWTYTMSIARIALFSRAFANVITNHPSIRESPLHARKQSFVRVMGELVSLLALIYIAETDADSIAPVMGVMFAFFVPSVLIDARNVSSVRRFFSGTRFDNSVAVHIVVGVSMVCACAVAYGALARRVSVHNRKTCKRVVQCSSATEEEDTDSATVRNEAVDPVVVDNSDDNDDDMSSDTDDDIRGVVLDAHRSVGRGHRL